jgi:hypothetical protein
MQVVATILWMGGVFVASVVLTALVMRTVRKRPARKRVNLGVGAKIRLISPSGVFISLVVSENDDEIHLSPPVGLQPGRPFEPGDVVFAQVPDGGLLLSFRSTILRREIETGDLVLSMPTHARQVNRRIEERLTHVKGHGVTVDDATGLFLDISASGAQVILPTQIKAGQPVQVRWDDLVEPVPAWVLDCRPVFQENPIRYRVRLRFREPLSGL